MEYTQRSENQFIDALATVGSQIPFEGESTSIRVSKQQSSIIGTLKRMVPEESEQNDWRDETKREIQKLEHNKSIKELKDYTLIEGNYTGGCSEESCPDVSMKRKGNRS